MQELLVDYITSLDGYGAAKGWPGFWALQGPEYLAWLDERSEQHYINLMGANTYRIFSGMGDNTEGGMDDFMNAPKIVFSSTLQPPLKLPNTQLIREDAVEVVRKMKEEGDSPMTTIGSLSLARSLLKAGLVDRFRVVIFPVINGSTGYERIYDGYPDVGLKMINHRTFDNSIQLVEYVPTVLDGPPNTSDE